MSHTDTGVRKRLVQLQDPPAGSATTWVPIVRHVRHVHPFQNLTFLHPHVSPTETGLTPVADSEILQWRRSLNGSPQRCRGSSCVHDGCRPIGQGHL